METVFSYGTLQDPKIQQKILGRTVSITPASLTGFSLSNIELEDGVFKILIPNQNSTEVISGFCLSITSEELKRFDEYETEAYQRSLLTLENGNQAWVYHQ